MKIDNKLNIVLPFYTAIEKQAWRKRHADGDYQTCERLTPANRLLPFQIRTIADHTTVSAFVVYDIDGTVAYNLNTALIQVDTRFNLATASFFDYLTYFGAETGPLMSAGYYYLQVETTGGLTWWSEVFHICGFSHDPVIDAEYENGGGMDAGGGETLIFE